MQLTEKTCKGFAWFKNGFKPVYNYRQIKKGKNKGKIEIVIRLFCGSNGFRKKIVSKKAINFNLTFSS